ncbi:hypothetical protein [Vineibacter terrae]|uniref:hypothetical protein n=1 Tax=Vineibacter terrae TaxID=2586908 RepID=UPI002E337D87|nr:hypothetical protein [Vineibacter terrae]HEX2890941.1 hypothetical protein [Vineibacter terrae]
MRGLWKFLKQDKNRAVLGWLGGGLVVVATGAWAVLTFVVKPDTPGKPSVSATCGSVAAGGDIKGPVTVTQSGASCPPK